MSDHLATSGLSGRIFLNDPANRSFFEHLSDKQLFRLYELIALAKPHDDGNVAENIMSVIEDYALERPKRALAFARRMLGSENPTIRVELTFFVLGVAHFDRELALKIFRELMTDEDETVRSLARQQVHDQLSEARMGASPYPYLLEPELRLLEERETGTN